MQVGASKSRTLWRLWRGVLRSFPFCFSVSYASIQNFGCPGTTDTGVICAGSESKDDCQMMLYIHGCMIQRFAALREIYHGGHVKL